MDINSIANIIRNNQMQDDEEFKRQYDINHITNNSNENQVASVVRQNLAEHWSIAKSEADKYRRYGLQYNPQDAASGLLDTRLAEAQSNWSKLGHALAQTVVSEIGLGTVLGISDLFDFIGQAVGASDHDYQNPVSRKLEEWQETFKNEVAPIYSKPGSGFGSGTDFGWWMQNIPSIASSLTLLIPAKAGTTILSKVGKGLTKGLAKGATKIDDVARAAGKSAKAERWARRVDRLESGNLFNLSSANMERLKLFGENATTAAISRTMENYQESRQVYNDMYTETADALNNMTDEEYENFVNRNKYLLEGANINDRNSVAKAVARKSADLTFKLDYANTVFDIIELYALRNLPFKGFRDSKVGMGARRLDRNARRFAGKYNTIAELEELAKKQNFGKKTLDAIGDVGYFAAHNLYGQLSEGVEEAVNTIASNEGMHLGHSMLNMESYGTFSNRLNQYVKSPELWESAFWGVAGGVVFQGAGSGINRLQNAYNKKQELKSKKANEKTGEDVKANATHESIWELPDTKRVKASIETRLSIENNYREKVKQIETGNNPYVSGEKINSEEEKQVLLERAFNERRTSMILDAMDSGTIDLLRGYLEDDNVKNALINSNIVTKEMADKIQQEDIAAIDKLQAKYDENIRILNNASRNIARKKHKTIPIEYLQIIARNNMESKLLVEDYEEQLSHWTKEAAALRETFKDKGLDPNINYEELIRLNWLTVKLGELEAEKRQINKDAQIFKSISGQERLKTIDANIKNIRKMVSELNPENKVANLLHAIEISYSAEYTPKGLKFTGESDDYSTFRKAATEKDYEYFKKLDEQLVDIAEADFGSQQVLDDNMRRAIGEKYSTSIRKVSEELGSAYATLAALQYQIASEKSNIKLTEQEIEDEASNIHNYLNELRKHKISDASEQIQGLADKYGAEQIRKLVTQRYKGEAFDFADINISEDDKNLLIEALDTLNLDEKMNNDIFAAIDNILANWDNIKAAQNKRKGEKSSASQKPISDDEKSKIDNPLSQGQNPLTEPKSGQNNENTSQTDSSKQSKTNNQSGLNVANIGDKVTITNDGFYNYKATDNPDQFEVNFSVAPVNDKYFNNHELFDQQKGLDLTQEEAEFIVAKNPVIDRQGNVIEKGLLVIDNEENRKELQKEIDKVNPQPTTFSTGEFVPTPEVEPEPATTTNEDRAGERPFDADEIDLSQYVFQAIRDAMKNGTEINWQEVRDNIVEVLKSKNITVDDSTLNYIENIIISGKNTADRHNVKHIDVVVDVMIKSSRIRETSDTKTEKEFSDAVEELIKVFNLEIGCDIIDGVKYINLEALCRYCDKVLNNKMASKHLLDNLIELVNKNDNLVPTDKNLSGIKDRLSEPIATVIKEKPYLGIDFNSVLRQALKDKTGKELNDILTVIDNINEGDALSVNRGKYGMTFSINGATIGSLPYPKPFGNEGGKYQYNNYWRTDILSSKGVVIESKLRDLFIKWATDFSDDSIKELNKIILQYAYNKGNKEDLINKFKYNSEIKKALEEGYISDEFHIKEALDGISEIWKFTRANSNLNLLEGNELTTITEEQLKELRIADINQWFQRVSDSFDFIEEIKNNPNLVVEVNSISEGEIIQVPENEALPVSKAIGSNYKGKVRIGIIEQTGVITVGGNGIDGTNKLDFYRGSKGNTFIIIPNRTGHHAYVHAFPQKVNADSLGKTAKEIKYAIFNEISRICNSTEYVSPKEQVEAIEQFLRKVLPNRIANSIDSTSSFFNQRKRNGAYISIDNNNYKGKNNGITIAFKREEDNTVTYINVYNNGGIVVQQKIDGKYKAVIPTMTMQEFHQYITNVIDDCCAFNLSFDAIKSDTEGISGQRLTRRGKNGEFIVDIPGHEPFVFKSYNDFVIENDLVLATTKPSEDGKSNYNRITETNETTQQITVRLREDSTSPVEKVVDINQKSNPIIDILNNKRIKNKGEHIANTILAKNISKNFVKLFPKNIIFVDEYIGDNAVTNTSDRPITSERHNNLLIPANTVVLGKEWMEMANNEREDIKFEAVKKLIHEQLHILLSNAEAKDIERIREIFNEFEAKNEDRSLDKYLFKESEDYYDNGKINLEGLEDFLVESLTSNKLAEGLNKIKAEVKDKTGKKDESLWQKLMRLIADFIGIDIKENSLYEKEFELLRDLFNPNDNKEEETNNPINAEPESNDALADRFGFGLFTSRITETEDVSKNTPTVVSFVDSFPVEDKAQIRTKIENGEISISCK